MIRAGTRDELSDPTALWIIIDIGFSNKKRTCGVSLDLADPICVTFSQLKQLVVDHITDSSRPCNLLIEAPLSVAFDSLGNPIGRSIEKEGSKTRYWYVGLGCAVTTAALYLVKTICDAVPDNEVRLFEGFVTYKPKGVTSDHALDVRLLREVVQNLDDHSDCLFDADALAMTKESVVVNAFDVAGLSTGVPLVIKRSV